MTRRIVVTIGTRPEAIKMAPLIHALRAKPERFETTVCVTGQHRGMLDQALAAFALRPDVDLNVMKQGQDLFNVTASILVGMRDVIATHRPHALLVHGDTSTAFTAALAGFYAGVPVGHVEAGLRTYDVRSPFPEEFNRQVTAKIARWHFAPTARSRDNLLSERVPESAVTVTGNTVIDALMWILAKLDRDEPRRADVERSLAEVLGCDWRGSRIVLITGHRRENFGEGFVEICASLQALAEAFPDVRFVYPVHLNPHVQDPVRSMLGGRANVHLIDPLDYESFVYLLKHSYLVLTDSGGVQEEAPSLGKPVLVMRNVTERPEAVEAGTARLVGANRSAIVRHVTLLLSDVSVYEQMARAHNPYGDGKACERIVNVLSVSPNTEMRPPKNT